MANPPALTADDRQSIMDLMYRFYWLVDQGRAGETATLFTSTAKLTFGPGSPKPGTVEGDAIPPAMIARAQQNHVTTRHALSNIRLTPNGDGVIEGYSLLTLYRSDTESRDTHPASVADIEELFVREGGEWRIQKRDILPIFNRA